MSVKVLALANGRHWIGEVVEYIGKEATVSNPLYIHLDPPINEKSNPQISLVPVLFFSDETSVKLTVTCLHDPYTPHKELLDDYIRNTTGLYTPSTQESKLILG